MKSSQVNTICKNKNTREFTCGDFCCVFRTFSCLFPNIYRKVHRMNFSMFGQSKPVDRKEALYGLLTKTAYFAAAIVFLVIAANVASSTHVDSKRKIF